MNEPVAHIKLWQLHLLREELVRGITCGAIYSTGDEGASRGTPCEEQGGGSEEEPHSGPYPLPQGSMAFLRGQKYQSASKDQRLSDYRSQ